MPVHCNLLLLPNALRLQQEGVPVLEGSYKTQRQTSSTSDERKRDHVRYANVESARWKRRHPEASSDDVKTIRSRYLTAWHGTLNESDRQAWLAENPAPLTVSLQAVPGSYESSPLKANPCNIKS